MLPSFVSPSAVPLTSLKICARVPCCFLLPAYTYDHFLQPVFIFNIPFIFSEMEQYRFNLCIFGGGRFDKATNGKVAYHGNDVKIAELTEVDCSQFTLMDLFHVGKKMDLLNGTPKRVWYVSPGMPTDDGLQSLTSRLVPIKTANDLQVMFSRAYTNNAWLEVYFQDVDYLASDGEYYMLPDDISNGGDAEFSDEQIDAVVKEKEKAEATIRLLAEFGVEFGREYYRLNCPDSTWIS